MLKHPINDVDAPADGPFPKGSYADAPGVKPLGFDILLAKMLVAAAQQGAGRPADPADLRVSRDPRVPRRSSSSSPRRSASPAWRSSRSRSPSRDSRTSSGRGGGSTSPIASCGRDDPILDAGPLLCPGYDAPPETDPLASAASPRILQLLLQLERAGEWPTARGLAIADRSRVARRAGRHPALAAGRPLRLADAPRRARARPPTGSIDGIEEWQISPWIARDPWETNPQAQGRNDEYHARCSRMSASIVPGQTLDRSACASAIAVAVFSARCRDIRIRPANPARRRPPGTAGAATVTVEAGDDCAEPAQSGSDGRRADRAAAVSDRVPLRLPSLIADRRRARGPTCFATGR